jgi:hypothetical protein
MKITANHMIHAGKLCTRNEAGQHFYEWADMDIVNDLEEAGLITIHVPVHNATGLRYGESEHSVEYVGPDVWDSYGNLREDWRDWMPDNIEVD